ncbi:MAG: hypothetical protein HZA51_11320 [Planctomycetes bacterium]|nr:hypothetical protein [Planctomycetota bacterium]
MAYAFLCATPWLVGAIVAIRPLRTAGVYHLVGAFQIVVISLAAWTLGARAIRHPAQTKRMLASASLLLMSPFAMMALLWPGLGPPWEATAAENQMRYLVLIGATIAIVVGFIMLKATLSETGERHFATLGFAAIVLAGPIYLVWGTFMFGANFAKEHTGRVPEGIASLNEALDLMLFLGGALTYLATSAFAVSMGHVQWLGRGATRIYGTLNLVAFLFLLIRGLQFPDPKALSAPWYTSPGLIVGIPAVPFIMPFLLGVVLLRRAGDELQ